MTTVPQGPPRPPSPALLARLERKQHITRLDEASTLQERTLALFWATALGVLFDLFFKEHRFGVSVLLYGMLLTAAVLTTTRIFRRPLFSGFLLSASLLLCLSYSLFNNGALQVLNALAIPLGFTAAFLSARYGLLDRLHLSCLGALPAQLVPRALGAAPKLVTVSLMRIFTRQSQGLSQTRRSILKGLLLGLPLLTVVVLLLSSSDAVFSRLVADRFAFLETMGLDELIGHGLTMVIGAFYFFGYLWSFRYELEEPAAPPAKGGRMDAVTALTVMVLLLAVYLFFTVIQFTYLYGGMGLPEGMTYADYARRGFFELVFAALLNLAVILGTSAAVNQEGGRPHDLLKLCNTLLTVLTVNLLISAFYRMHLYEAAYGFTQLRLFVQFFMGSVAVTLGGLGVWIWKRRLPLLKVALGAAVTFYVVLNFINVDLVIAQNNLARYQSTQTLDVYYLRTLSVDAWPAISAADLPTGLKNQLLWEFRNYHGTSLGEEEPWFTYNYHLNQYRQSLKPVFP